RGCTAGKTETTGKECKRVSFMPFNRMPCKLLFLLVYLYVTLAYMAVNRYPLHTPPVGTEAVDQEYRLSQARRNTPTWRLHLPGGRALPVRCPQQCEASAGR